MIEPQKMSEWTTALKQETDDKEEIRGLEKLYTTARRDSSADKGIGLSMWKHGDDCQHNKENGCCCVEGVD